MRNGWFGCLQQQEQKLNGHQDYSYEMAIIRPDISLVESSSPTLTIRNQSTPKKRNQVITCKPCSRVYHSSKRVVQPQKQQQVISDIDAGETHAIKAEQTTAQASHQSPSPHESVCLPKQQAVRKGPRATKHNNPKGKLERKERKKEDGAIPQSSPPSAIVRGKSISAYSTTGHTATLLRRGGGERESETMPAG